MPDDVEEVVQFNGEDAQVLLCILITLVKKLCYRYGVDMLAITEQELEEAVKWELRCTPDVQRELVRVWVEKS